ncbi:succinyl-diaminopimelate desuccinylase [Hellea balneolensis]|uniref:succinyl-diaminopimelate desuccinylase n=1 Tax=Hellea balneolensis TaxID=287478 RepID=UPI0004269402|nr:succinyl-diaminopimelate desuccinylase [Hellea balneolensis]
MTTLSPIDPVNFAAALIKRPSVTPADAGALDTLQHELEAMGFNCKRYPFGKGADRVDNLYARLGTIAPNFCFAGHTDVVPAGDAAKWAQDPFAGQVKEGQLLGRGAADMKGAIAAFVGAVSDLLFSGWTPEGSISFLITGDEEGPAINGTKKLLVAIDEAGEKIDHCLVGEPTNPNQMGEMVKNGRRGSFNADLTVTGHQGHVAYPHLAVNPVPTLLGILGMLQSRHLDDGSEFFQPSNLEITTVDVGNPTENMIPETARARFNIRFNVAHSGASLTEWVEGVLEEARAGFDGSIDINIRVSGESFLTPPGKLTDILQDAAESVLGQRPKLSTSGGTSDARFITNYAPVAEFGLVGATMHKVNERVDVADILTLTAIYKDVLRRYFA